MLQHFEYISSDGHDQGSNVRNRAKELYNLLSDVNKIRSERKSAKARRERNGKHSRGFGSVSGITYGGSHGYDTDYRRNSINSGFGGYSGGVYGDGGGFDESSGRYDSDSQRGGFEEYEVDLPEINNANSYVPSLGRSNTARIMRTSSQKETPPPPPPAQKQVDLFSFDDERATVPQSSAAIDKTKQNAFNTSTSAAGQDDEFDDFQSADKNSTETPASAQKPINNILDLFNAPSQSAFDTNTMPSYNTPITPMGGPSHNRSLSMMPLDMSTSSTTSTRPANYSHNRSFSTMSNVGANELNSSFGTGTSSGAATKKEDAFSSIWASTKVKSAAAGPTSKPAAPQESLI
ncbi:hypothetical protein D0Z03_001419 [Geotrichum reessii]|nr:hypothetical protein D0Z03_001419 [Galactomyces reessii]